MARRPGLRLDLSLTVPLSATAASTVAHHARQPAAHHATQPAATSTNLVHNTTHEEPQPAAHPATPNTTLEPPTPDTPEILDTLATIAAQELPCKLEQPWAGWRGKIEHQDLTRDDERRRRRRERNKVAAEKCRMRKRERTSLLITEAEVLEAAHSSLRAEVARLRGESRVLREALRRHRGSCRIPSYGRGAEEREDWAKAETPMRSAEATPSPGGEEEYWGGGGWGGGGVGWQSSHPLPPTPSPPSLHPCHPHPGMEHQAYDYTGFGPWSWQPQPSRAGDPSLPHYTMLQAG